MTIEQLDVLMASAEDEHLEFKAATGNFHFEKLAKYCAALANEKGGKMILGVTNKRPRKVVGTGAFRVLGRTKAGLVHELRLRIDVEELDHPDGRVLVFHVPSRPDGMPVQYKGAYWMRSGDSLVPMTPDMLKRIFAETGPDFSAEICPSATAGDLAPEAIEAFRTMWLRKSGNNAIAFLAVDRLIADAELLQPEGVTYAALILLGKEKALARFLSQAEVVLEYRSGRAPGPAQQRKEYRKAAFLFLDDLWETINTRNDMQHFQDGLFMRDIPTFSEAVVREAILNAVSHRDYRSADSVFVRQHPEQMEIVSPGGFPPGVTPENLLWRQSPRNRRIAEVFAKCGLVERAGQGADRMFEQSIRDGKGVPDFSDSDEYQVSLTLQGNIQDPAFLRFLERVGAETSRLFGTEDLLVLDLVRRDQKVPDRLRPVLRTLTEQGVVETHGRGRGVRHILSHRYYALAGKTGVYTRKRGLDRETNKELLFEHIKRNVSTGSQLKEFMQVLPALNRNQVRRMLRELKREGRIVCRGRTRGARWFPA